MTTVQYVVAVALSLLVFVMMANFIVFLYARGVVRAAVDEGARTGGRTGAGSAECEARAGAVCRRSARRRPGRRTSPSDAAVRPTPCWPTHR